MHIYSMVNQNIMPLHFQNVIIALQSCYVHETDCVDEMKMPAWLHTYKPAEISSCMIIKDFHGDGL